MRFFALLRMTMWILGTVSVAIAFERFIFIVVLNKKEEQNDKKA
jgi:hypothetical protein